MNTMQSVNSLHEVNAKSLLVRQAKFLTFVARVLGEENALRPLLQNCVDALVQILDVVVARAWVFDKWSEDLRVVATCQNDQTRGAGLFANLSFGSSKIEVAARDRQTIWTNEISSHALSDLAAQRAHGIQSFIGCPLFGEGNRLVGALAIFLRTEIDAEFVAWFEQIANSIGTVIDRKPSTEGSAESSTRFEQLNCFGREVTWQIDWRTQRIAWGPNLFSVFGYEDTPEVDSATWWYSKIHPDDQPLVESSLKDAVASGQSDWTHDYRFAKPDGKYTKVRHNANITANAAREVTGIVGAMHDLTRIQTQDAVHRVATETTLDLVESPDFRSSMLRLAKALVPALADWCTIDGKDEQGTIRRLAAYHHDSSKTALLYEDIDRFGVDPHSSWGISRVLRQGESQFQAHVTQKQLAESGMEEPRIALLQMIGLQSFVCVPLETHSEIIGCLTVAYADSKRNYDAHDVGLFEETGKRAALALENVRLRDAIRHSEAQLRTIVENVPDLAWSARPDGYIDFFNQRWYDYTGTTPQQMEGWGWTAVHAPESLPEVLANWKQSLATGTSFEMEFPLRNADGEFRWFRTRVRPLRDWHGLIVHWFGISTDIHDQKQQAMGLSRFATIIEQSNDCIGLWTTEGRGIFLNESGRKLLGYDSEFETFHASQLFAADGALIFKEEILPALAENGFWRGEIPVVNQRTGVEIPADCNIFLTKDENGVEIGHSAIIRDITEQKRSQEALLDELRNLEILSAVGTSLSAELHLEKLLQQIVDAGTALAGSDVTLLWLARSAENASGVFSSGALHFTPEKFDVEISSVQDLEEGIAGLKRRMAEGGMKSFVALPLVGRTGSILGCLMLAHGLEDFFAERSQLLLQALASQAAVAIDNAILIQNAERLISDLRKSNRDLDQFAYIASHDLKAPLRSIASISEWLEEDFGQALNADGRQHLATLRGRVLRLDRLINGILEYSRAAQTENQVEKVVLDELLAEVIDSLGYRDRLQIKTSHPLPHIYAEKPALRQVFRNLISNAAKYGDALDRPLEFEWRDDDSSWEFSLKDHGIGIAPAYQQRIFDIFQTLNSRDRVESTGIGLAVVRRILDSRGGKIWLESNVNQGAAFTFTWPKHTPSKIPKVKDHSNARKTHSFPNH